MKLLCMNFMLYMKLECLKLKLNFYATEMHEPYIKFYVTEMHERYINP